MSDLFNSSPRAIPSLHLNLKVAVAIFYFQTNAVRKWRDTDFKTWWMWRLCSEF